MEPGSETFIHRLGLIRLQRFIITRTMIHEEACIAQEQSSLLSVKCLFVSYLPKHVKSKRVKISNYK